MWKHRDIQNPNLGRLPQNVEPADRLSVLENQLITGFRKLRPIVGILRVELKLQKGFSLFVAPRNHGQLSRARTRIDFSEKRFVFGRNLTQGNRHRLGASFLLNQTIEDRFVVSAILVAADGYYKQFEVSHLIV